MSDNYDTLRAAYMNAKAEVSRLESELMTARTRMLVAERAAVAEWRNLTQADRIGSLVNVSQC